MKSLDTLKLIVDNEISVDFAPCIVWVMTRAPIANQSKSVGVKFTETNGDKGKALELAVKRLLGDKECLKLVRIL